MLTCLPCRYDNGIVCDGSVRVRRLQLDQVDAAGAITGFLDDKRVGLRQSKTTFVNDANGGTDMETRHCEGTRSLPFRPFFVQWGKKSTLCT